MSLSQTTQLQMKSFYPNIFALCSVSESVLCVCVCVRPLYAPAVKLCQKWQQTCTCSEPFNVGRCHILRSTAWLALSYVKLYIYNAGVELCPITQTWIRCQTNKILCQPLWGMTRPIFTQYSWAVLRSKSSVMCLAMWPSYFSNHLSDYMTFISVMLS